MSRLTRAPLANRYHKATGARWPECQALDKAGLIPSPLVPDALNPDQRRFEAMIVLVLAKALSDRQLDRALLGFRRVTPTPHGISLDPHPVMANRVLRELLPRLDDEHYGELRGVPGLRARWHQGTIVLHDLSTTAEVHVIWPRRHRPAAADLESPGRALWRLDRLDAEEAHDRKRWSQEAYRKSRQRWAAEAAARDWLMSRVLRLVALLNQGASPHGYANTYSHGNKDLIVESCCRTDPAKIKRLMRKSEMAVSPKDPLLEALEAPEDGAGQISLRGRIGVTFRCLRDDGCASESGRMLEADIAEQRREWYS